MLKCPVVLLLQYLEGATRTASAAFGIFADKTDSAATCYELEKGAHVSELQVTNVKWISIAMFIFERSDRYNMENYNTIDIYIVLTKINR